jgi:hypothetical protein
MKPNKTFEMYFDYYNELPEFIDCLTNLSKEVWDNMYEINEKLFNLFTDKILTPRKLKSINNTIDLLFDEIIYLLPVNSPIICDIDEYYKELFLTFIGIAEINEDFEIAANLKNYYDSYIK